MSNNKRARTVFAKKPSCRDGIALGDDSCADRLRAGSLLSRTAQAAQPAQDRSGRATRNRSLRPRSLQDGCRRAVERIEITGTRIPQVNVEGPSPVHHAERAGHQARRPRQGRGSAQSVCPRSTPAREHEFERLHRDGERQPAQPRPDPQTSCSSTAAVYPGQPRVPVPILCGRPQTRSRRR